MLFLKRTIRIAIPALTLMVGVTLYADSRTEHSCANLSIKAKVMQFAGLGQIQPCAVDPATLWCADDGHHCNVGNGPGKCRNMENDQGQFVCQCLVK
jgi:hypothetical protein